MSIDSIFASINNRYSSIVEESKGKTSDTLSRLFPGTQAAMVQEIFSEQDQTRIEGLIKLMDEKIAAQRAAGNEITASTEATTRDQKTLATTTDVLMIMHAGATQKGSLAELVGNGILRKIAIAQKTRVEQSLGSGLMDNGTLGYAMIDIFNTLKLDPAQKTHQEAVVAAILSQDQGLQVQGKTRGLFEKLTQVLAQKEGKTPDNTAVSDALSKILKSHEDKDGIIQPPAKHAAIIYDQIQNKPDPKGDLSTIIKKIAMALN